MVVRVVVGCQLVNVVVVAPGVLKVRGDCNQVKVGLHWKELVVVPLEGLRFKGV